MAAAPRWLFVCYGGGHVRMLLPVALRIRELGLAQVEFLALTTARAEVQRHGFTCHGYADFTWLHGPGTLERGRQLLAGLEVKAADPQESMAYLGVNYEELEQSLGPEEAIARYARYGRQAFDPLRAMRRVLERLRPDLVVATSSPRSERAAIRAARVAGIPSACLVDLFALDELAWLGEPGFADQLCVLNAAVEQRLLQAGRQAGEIRVTGNPAFDACATAAARLAGAALRSARGWRPGRTVLFASAPEPAEHPFRPGVKGDADLPRRAFMALRELADACTLVIRPHPSEAAELPVWMQGAEIAGQDIALETVVNAVDLTVVLVSTVAVQARLAGSRVLQVKGALFESAAPFVEFGFAQAAVELSALAGAAQDILGRPAPSSAGAVGDATERVVSVLKSLNG